MITPRRAPTRRLPLAALAALLALILLATPARAQVVCNGPISLGTQAEVDAFAAQACTSVDGNVSIFNNDALTSLAGLENLTSVGGSLNINSNAALTSLAGLENLTSVDGTLNIQGNAALTSPGLEDLTSVGRLTIGFNAALTSLAGLENLTSVGSLDIEFNDALTSLAGLQNLTSVDGNFLISRNAALTSLAGLENLTSVGSLDIERNAALTSLAGLENLTSVGSLDIEFNDALTSLAGLENLTSVPVLSISRNAALTSLAGLENLTSVGLLRVISNAALTSLAGLENLTSASGVGFGRGIVISDNNALTSLAELENLTSVSALSISGNDALTSLAGLQNVTSLDGSFSSLSIRDNAALTSLAGLENVTSVGGNLLIDSNDALTSLAGLQNVTSVGLNLFIRFNATLASCASGLVGLISGDPPAFTGVSGTPTIDSNLSGCNSPQEVLDAYAALVVCEAGTFSATGFAPCTPAPPGFSVAEAGATEATACPVGRYQPESGQTACLIAPIGFYVDEPGAAAATACPDGQTTLGEGAVSAADCVAAGLTVAIAPLGTPDVGPYGGLVFFRVRVDNDTDTRVEDDLWVTLTEPSGDELLQFRTRVRLRSGRSAIGLFVTLVSRHAEAGTYTYTASVGDFPAASDSDAFSFVKQDPSGARQSDPALATYLSEDEAMQALSEAEARTGGPVAEAVEARLDGGDPSAVWGETDDAAWAAGASSEAAVPDVFALAAAYPNPFAERATLTLAVPEASVVRVVVYDALGRTVTVLLDGPVEAGRYPVTFDGAGLPSGTYLVRMTTEGGFTQTRRLTLVR